MNGIGRVIKMAIIGRYKNGNYIVTLLSDGTKIRENDLDFFEADFPESMDLKITNRCNMGCLMCHEDSRCDGLHGDIMSESFIDRLHPYTELAIGGGNVLEHPDFYDFLVKCKSLNLICSTTINQKHFMENLDFIRKLRDEKLIYGLGISLTNPWQDGFIDAVKEFPNAVIHVINGIVTMQDLEELRNRRLKILILGYKEFRRGEKLYEDSDAHKRIDELKQDLYSYLPEIVHHGWFDVVSFDNLAIKQLNPQRLMSDEAWNEMYMGDDNSGEMTSASMYVDMVKREFARNSCAVDRYPIMDNIEDMFNFLRGKNG